MKDKSKPLVSVIIPNFNGAKHISETLDSVIAQTFTNWEAIIVDDRSTDDSLQKVAPYLENSRLELIVRDNTLPKGGNVCRNLGINAAKGDYLIFLDSDDLLAPYCLEQRVRYFLQHNDIDFAVFNMRNFKEHVDDGVQFTRLDIDDPLRYFIAVDCIWQTTSPIWKRDFVINMGGFNEKFPRFQDPEMVVRALRTEGVKYHLVKDSKPDAYYRATPKSGMDKYKTMFGALCLFIDEFYPIEKGKWASSKKAIYSMLSLSIFLFGKDDDFSLYKTIVNKIGHQNKLMTFICGTRVIASTLRKNPIIKSAVARYNFINTKIN